MSFHRIWLQLFRTEKNETAVASPWFLHFMFCLFVAFLSVWLGSSIFFHKGQCFIKNSKKTIYYPNQKLSILAFMSLDAFVFCPTATKLLSICLIERTLARLGLAWGFSSFEQLGCWAEILVCLNSVHHFALLPTDFLVWTKTPKICSVFVHYKQMNSLR